MNSRFRVSGLLPRRLEELGLSLPAVLRQANLPIGLFNQEKILLTTEELFALYRGIAEVSRDPAIGLKLGSEQRLERDSPAPIAALYTRSFREAIQRELARYYLLHASLELNETAYLLGYENANSFFRAFHHWDGTSPGQWRHIQRRANGESPYCCSKAIMSGA